MDMERSRSVDHWPRNYTSQLEEDEVYYVDENCIIDRDEVLEQLKKEKVRDKYSYNKLLSIFGNKQLVKIIVQLDTQYRSGKIGKISRKLALSMLEEQEELEKEQEFDRKTITSIVHTSKSSKRHTKTIKEYIEDNLDEIIGFIEDNQSDKYFNIITMQPNSFLVSHYSSKLDIKILVPKVFSDNMLKKFDPCDMSPVDVLHMTEDMIIKKKPKLGINRTLEKEKIVHGSARDDVLRRGIDRMVLKGTSKNLLVNKVKSKEEERLPSRSDVSKSRVESRPSSSSSVTKTGLFDRMFGNQQQQGKTTTSSRTSSKQQKIAEEFDDEYVVSYGEGKDINYEEQDDSDGSELSFVIDDSADSTDSADSSESSESSEDD